MLLSCIYEHGNTGLRYAKGDNYFIQTQGLRKLHSATKDSSIKTWAIIDQDAFPLDKSLGKSFSSYRGRQCNKKNHQKSDRLSSQIYKSHVSTGIHVWNTIVTRCSCRNSFDPIPCPKFLVPGKALVYHRTTKCVVLILLYWAEFFVLNFWNVSFLK